MKRSALEAALSAAHAAGNGAEIARLYGKAADGAQATGQIDEACFFWVQAYVFALEAGDPNATIYQSALAKYGREVLPSDP